MLNYFAVYYITFLNGDLPIHGKVRTRLQKKIRVHLGNLGAPIERAVTEKNAAGKLVCPFSNCAKQYVGILQLGRHMIKDPYQDLSLRDKRKVREMTSTPRRRLKGVGSSSPSFPVTPVKVRFSTGKAQSRGTTKRNSNDADMTPAQTRSKKEKMFQSRNLTKRNSPDAGVSPAQTRSKTRKCLNPMQILLKKQKLFPGKYPKL